MEGAAAQKVPFKGEAVHLGPITLLRKGMVTQNFIFQSWQSSLLLPLYLRIELVAGIRWSNCFSAKIAVWSDAVEGDV